MFSPQKLSSGTEHGRNVERVLRQDEGSPGVVAADWAKDMLDEERSSVEDLRIAEVSENNL